MKKISMFFAVVFMLGFTAAPVFSQDSDSDGILDDGDSSGIVGDNPCPSGVTENCDDNCLTTPNTSQEDTFPPGGNGVGDACECEGDLNCD